VHFEILSNPEFLAEGTAIQDLFKSDRVLIGGDKSKTGQQAVQALVDIYSNWIPKEKILTTNIWSSELAKLASNAMLAQRISSINSLSALCEKTGADIEELSKAIGMDHRIGPKFLKASVGFGGSCLKKDILNLVYLSKYYGLHEVAEFWHQVVKINDYQRDRFSNKIIEVLEGNVKDKTVTVLGWAFKKNTNDSRESASIYVSINLLLTGVKLKIYDPMVQKTKILFDLELVLKEKGFSQKEINSKFEKVILSNSCSLAIEETDAIAVTTEWDEFKNYDWDSVLKKQSKLKILDGRGVLSKADYSIGK